MATLAKSRSRRPALFALTLCVLLAGLSSCSYLLGDPYGGFGQRVVARSDLNAAVHAATGFDIRYIDGMSFNASGGRSYLFLFLTTADEVQRLVILDGGSLDLDATRSGFFYNPSGSNIGVDLNGNFVFGNGSYLVLSPTLANVISALPGGQLCLVSDSIDNLSLTTTTTSPFQLLCQSHPALWTPPGPSTQPTLTASATQWSLATAATSGGRLLLLFASSGSVIEVGYPYSAGNSILTTFTNMSSSVPPGYVIDNAPNKTAAVGNYYQMAWPTEAGLVVGSYGKGLKLDFHKFGDSGTTSSYSLDTSGSATVYFEPSGSYFFYFDQAAGRLYKLRTWW